MMNLIVLHGLPGVGKLTVARELRQLTGYRLFHNHLTVDLLTAVFEFGSAPFVELRERIWLDVFARAAEAGRGAADRRAPGLIFTFAFEPTVRDGFFDQVVTTVEARGGRVLFVELRCDPAELDQRLVDPSRRAFGKLTDLAELHRLRASGGLATPAIPRPNLIIDTTRLEPARAAGRICDHYAIEVGTS